MHVIQPAIIVYNLHLKLIAMRPLATVTRKYELLEFLKILSVELNLFGAFFDHCIQCSQVFKSTKEFFVAPLRPKRL